MNHPTTDHLHRIALLLQAAAIAAAQTGLDPIAAALDALALTTTAIAAARPHDRTSNPHEQPTDHDTTDHTHDTDRPHNEPHARTTPTPTP